MGGIVQLSAYGSQDIYLTTNPDITFFKAVYKRNTHFSIESIQQLIEGNINFGGNISFVVNRNGDLLGSIILQVCLPLNPQDYVINEYSYCGYIQGVGNYLINNVLVEIGGSTIDVQYGGWMDIWSEISINESRIKGYGSMVGKDYSQPAWAPYDVSVIPGGRLYIPLQFWFCKNPGLALPLIALQYHEVRIKLQIEKFENLITVVKDGQYIEPRINQYPNLNSREFKIWNTYYFLDSTERRQFSQNPHEYLIEQIQSQNGNVYSVNSENVIRLNLNHPTKEIIFVFSRNKSK